MSGCSRNVVFIISIILIMERLTDVSTECSNYWLDQYEDVLPSINSRPEFPDRITDAFEASHFGRSAGALGMALCHVISWFDIRCRLDILFEDAFNKESESTESNDENYNDIRNFLSKLYTPDTEAVVNFGAWYPPLTFESWDKPDKPWFEQTPYSRPFVGDYMTDELEELTDVYLTSALDYLDSEKSEDAINFWKEANEKDPDTLLEIRKQNAKAIKKIFLSANTAPPNLRYGDSVTNSGISENYDPMGDISGTITMRESEFIKDYVSSYETEEIEGEYYLRSSTGFHQPDSEFINHWYIKCMTNDKECF